MDNGQEGPPPPPRDGHGNTRRVIGIRRIHYAGTGLPPVETADSPGNIHSGGASPSEPVAEKEGESPEPPSSPELPVLNQQEIQDFYRESLLAMKAADSARKLTTSTSPDNELMFYDSASSGSQATNPELLESKTGSRSDMAPYEDRGRSPSSRVSDDLKCEDARAISPSLSVHISRATSPTGVSISRATSPTAGVSISRATSPTGVRISHATSPTAGVSISRATSPTGVRISRATSPTAGVSISRATSPTGVRISRATSPTAGVIISRATSSTTVVGISRASTPTAGVSIPQDPSNEVVSAARQTTGIRRRIRRAFSRLLRPFRSCFGHR